MARYRVTGMDEYIRQLEDLAGNADGYIGKAVYEGAGLVADAIRANIQGLSAVEDGVGAHAYRAGTYAPLTESAKAGLLEGFGISELRAENGYYHVKLGFDGYNRLRTRRFPKGQPNVLIARTFERGNSFTARRPFIKPALQATRTQCEETMNRVLNDEIEKLMK